jgi:DNA-binding response OmpR family regulator
MNNTEKKILLIDDEEVILFGFKQVLSAPKLHIDTASTVEEANALIDKNSYAAAVIDLRLSNSTKLEGLELVSVLKRAQKDCHVIVLTAYGDDEVHQKALSAGADLFLEKPVDPDLIRMNLENIGVY